MKFYVINTANRSAAPTGRIHMYNDCEHAVGRERVMWEATMTEIATAIGICWDCKVRPESTNPTVG